MLGASFDGFPIRSGFVVQEIGSGRGFTICVIDLLQARWYAGIARDKSPNGDCRFCRHILGTLIAPIPIGI
jgi:hypothetical protein